jgi:hypothetical protein
MLTQDHRNRGRLALIALLLIVVVALAPAAHAGESYRVRVENASAWNIHRIYLSSASNRYWGPDLLGSYTLRTGYVFTTRYIPAGTYDLKLVDEDGGVCIVRRVAIYRETDWQITNRWLLACELQ